MIDKELLESLVRILDESSLDNLEIKRGGTRIRLSKSPRNVQVTGGHPVAMPPLASPDPVPLAAAPPVAPVEEPVSQEDAAPAASVRLVEVVSPMVGTFYRAPSPEADPYVEEGASVSAGDVLCVIEAMKLMNELPCEVAGRIAEICVGNAEPVDYGQVLFRVDPD